MREYGVSLRRLAGVVGGLAVALVLTSPVSAVPIEWSAATGGNSHRYEIVFDTVARWDQARQAAEQRGGYLATITSQAEQTFIINNLFDISPEPAFGAYWLGLNDALSEGNYRWVTGEPFSFSFWGDG